MNVVEMVKAKESFAECNACGSTNDIWYLRIGREHKTSLKFCNDCRLEVIEQFKEVTEN